MKLSRESVQGVFLRVFIGIYLALGIYTTVGLIEILPARQHLLADFFIYERAAQEAVLGKDPYIEKRIGTAFVYPPQSIAFFEVFGIIQTRTGKIWALTISNIAMMLVMVRGVIKHYQLDKSKAWILYPLGLGFAPFIELLYVGQVNQFIEFGLFLMFAFGTQMPWLAGFGLGWATMLKVTPAVFGAYLLMTRQWKTIISTFIIVLAFSIFAWIRYGIKPFINYVDAFRHILGQFPIGLESHSLFAVINRFVEIGEHASTVQSVLNIYLVVILASGLISYYAKTPDLFFVTLGLGITLTPNLLWYHHYVFLLLPFFILIGWSGLNPRVLTWCLFGFIIIQIDRFYLTAGLLTHIFAHLTIVGLIIYQINLAQNQSRTSMRMS